MRVLIIGSGGHARVVADILSAMDGVRPIGYASRDALPGAKGPLGLPILGSDEDVSGIPHDAIVVAIGDTRTRYRVFSRLAAADETLFSAVHPSAIIAPDVVIGRGCMICAGVVINTGATIGEDTILNTGCTVDHDCVIGPHVHVAPGVNLAGNVQVGEGAFIGIGACAVPGVKIGPWATVGAGAAVIGNVDPEAVVAGVPAKPLSR